MPYKLTYAERFLSACALIGLSGVAGKVWLVSRDGLAARQFIAAIIALVAVLLVALMVGYGHFSRRGHRASAWIAFYLPAAAAICGLSVGVAVAILKLMGVGAM